MSPACRLTAPAKGGGRRSRCALLLAASHGLLLALLGGGCGGSGEATATGASPRRVASGEGPDATRDVLPRRRAFKAGEITVKATGVAAGTDKAAEVQAERQALAGAVERALGRTMGATLTKLPLLDEHRRVVREKILGRPARGFVSRYRKLSVDAKDGATSVTVQAVVKAGEMKDELAAIRRVLEGKRMPRLMVVVGPFDETGKPGEIARLARGAIESAFVGRGFRLVDEGAAGGGKSVYDAFLDLARVGGKTDAVAEAARETAAEVVLAGSASLRSDRAFSAARGGARRTGRGTEPDSGKMNFQRPSVTLRAVETASGRVLFSGEETGIASVRADALPGAATALAERCIEEVVRKWQGEVRRLATVVVRVSGITFEDFARLRRMAEAITGVQAVRTRPFSGRTGELEVEHVRDPLDLAASFTALPGLPLKVVKASVRLVELEAGK